MASTGINSGGIAKITIGGNTVTHLINASLNITHEPREITVKGDGVTLDGIKTFGTGQKEWSISGEALMAEDSTYGRTEIFALINNRTLVEVRFASTVSGDKIYKGDAYITGLSASSGGQDDNESFSIDIKGAGAITEQVLT